MLQSSLDLAHTPPISPLSSPCVFYPFLNLPKSTFVECKIFVHDSHCLDKNLDEIDIDKLKDNLDIEDFTLIIL